MVMPRLKVLNDEELPVEVRSQVEQMESAGEDATYLRVLGLRADMFQGYLQWYFAAHEGGLLSPMLKETVRLYIAQLNDCSV